MQMAFLSLHGVIDFASFLAVAVVPAFAGDLISYCWRSCCCSHSCWCWVSCFCWLSFDNANVLPVVGVPAVAGVPVVTCSCWFLTVDGVSVGADIPEMLATLLFWGSR
jgi:hypothetical protein